MSNMLVGNTAKEEGKMPGLNGRGPQGEGPLTGRGIGRCRPAPSQGTDETVPNVDNTNSPNDTNSSDNVPVAGQGMGMAWRRGGGGGGGMGRGMGRGTGRGMGRGRNNR